MGYVIGIDIGGTCTDSVVLSAEGKVALGKAFSTPPDFSRGIMDSLAVVAADLGIERSTLLREARLFLHSTSVAENAVVDRTLARTGIITTRGFEDTLAATRGGYGRWSGLTEDEKRNPINTDKLAPIVARRLIRGITERTDAHGNVLVHADEAEIKAAVLELVEAGIDALGVCLLWSFANATNEERVREIVQRVWPDGFVTLSHEIAPILGEYERTATVALNGGLGPVVQRYLENLRDDLRDEGFDGTILVMQAYGGLLPFEQAGASPVGMIESGPISGLVGSQELGRRIGSRNIIAADMGGTTFKVGTVREGAIEYQREPMVLRYHYSLPKIDMVSLGLAGGSIISIDPRTGAPRVGPRSAGSYPGPVCYGHGGMEPTVTDTDAVLGYLNPDFFLGGREKLDINLAREVYAEKVAGPSGLGLTEAAAEMFRLANSLMYDLLHRTTVQRGLDPRGFDLYSFGGTAGMHVARYAEQLGVNRVVIPYSASVHSAFGLITSDIVHEDQITRPMRMPVEADLLKEIFDDLERRVLRQLAEEGFAGPDAVRLRRSIDMRYRRQVHILTVPVEQDGAIDDAALQDTLGLFERLYEQKYGEESAYREAGVELVTFRVRGSGKSYKPELLTSDLAGADASNAIVKTQLAWVNETHGMQELSGYDYDQLRPGNIVEGPAIMWTPMTTLVLTPGQRARVDEYRNVIIAMAGPSPQTATSVAP
ncbi:MAG: hydantoinase/oxoprolinase family protein [Solirubrobacteraceae bacterium]